MKKSAFTLIELLIVVAIIAVLAAIAVPNFLEAQTRAKVSRVCSDMRTIVNGIQAYLVDNNNKIFPAIPAGMKDDGAHHMWFLYGIIDGKKTGVGLGHTGRNPLTSPIAYMSSIPTDPFAKHYYWLNPGWGTKIEQLSVTFASATDPQWAFDFGLGDPRNRFDRFRIWIPKPQCKYYIRSAGPNALIISHDKGYVYDPTNGTISAGDIWYVDPVGWLGGIRK